MRVDECTTGITVTHNTKDLIERAYNSIRKFHPNMKLIIVDGSDRGDTCFTYVCGLASENTKVFHVDKNIGHGRGLCVGIERAETPFALIFDSDIEMLKSPIQSMLDMMEEDTYGVGYTEKTAFDGHEWGCKPSHLSQGWMRYLHPYFCLLQLKEYKKYAPFIHHGAPAVNAMLSVHRSGLADKVIKEFPGLGHSSGVGWVWKGEPREFIRHDTYGTRAIRRSKGLEEIEGVWERVVDSGGITCITCTGDRHLTFSLCEKWMNNQTIKPDQWIVIDDGKRPTSPIKNDYIKYVYRVPTESDPQFTLLLNVKEAFKHVNGSKILFIEDDEYYAPNYIEKMLKRLNDYELVGIGKSKYYHLPTRKWYIHPNMGHASLAQTAFRRSFLKDVVQIIDGDSFLDIRIWGIVNGHDAAFKNSGEDTRISNDGRGLVFEDKENLYVGMKGLPGRNGIGAGHKGNNDWYHCDKDEKVLRDWIKKEEDLKVYTGILQSVMGVQTSYSKVRCFNKGEKLSAISR